MSLHTNEPRCQISPMPPSSSRYPMGEFVRGHPEEIRCCPKHSTMFVAGFVAVRRTLPTRTFLSQLIVPTKLNIQRCIRACNPLRMGSQNFFCFHEPDFGLLGEHPVLESRHLSSF